MNSFQKIKDNTLLGLIYIATFLTLGILVWIIGYVMINGLSQVNWEFLSTNPVGEEGGVLPMIASTFYIVILSLLIATPIGIGAAIYLVEYAKPGKLVRAIRFCTESLAGIPSIIFGLFGMIFFVTILKLGFSLLAGAFTVSMMVLPTIIRTTEESLKSVPNAFREGSYGLGASKLRTIVKIILPSSIPGILAAVILSVGRVVGETAALYFTAGMVPRMPTSIMDSGRTLSIHMYLLAKEGVSFQKSFATATVLIIFVAVINFAANRIANALNKFK
ncbi:phosphate ABC transporter permease PstA [Clostridium sediminicola]|uniref:phosphate ABC transporter permease PstA n=1 Tax=Clostridium sediminicola TaxID=3114879 RepID=UPI0031F26AF2